MKSFALIAVLGLFGVAAPARADELIALEWMVAPDGSPWIWPNGDHPVEQRRPALWFGHGLFGDEARFADLLPRAGTITSLLVVLPGATDRASLTDAEHHFKQLKLGLTDAQIIERIRTVPDAKMGPALRRARLDRLLAVRLAGERKLAGAVEALKGIQGQVADEWFLRRAAAESLALIEGRALPPFRVPEPKSVLNEIPSDAHIVALIDQRKVPRWKRPWRTAHDSGVMIAKRTISALGGAVSDSQLAGGESQAQIPLEFGYEMARQFGNHTRLWSVVAIRTPTQKTPLAVWSHTAGHFELEPLRRELRRAKVPVFPTKAGGGIRADVLGDKSMLTVWEDVARFEMGQPVHDGNLAGELNAAGALDGAAIWIHVRDPAPFKAVPFLMGIEQMTIRVSFDGGIKVTIDALCKDKDIARGIKPLVMTMLMQAPPQLAGYARAVKVEPNDNRVRISFEVEGKTPEDLMDELLKDR